MKKKKTPTAIVVASEELPTVTPEKSKGGRPSSYREEYPAEAERLCLAGATDKELAEHFGCAESTINVWKNEYPEFSEAIKRGKTPPDIEVAHALFNRAKGFEFDEVQAIKLKTVTYADGKRVKEEEKVELVTVHRVVPPDTVACIFWLSNRRKDHWKQRVVAEHKVDESLETVMAEVRERVKERHLKLEKAG